MIRQALEENHLAGDANVGAPLDQRPDRWYAVARGGEHQRSLTPPGLSDVDIRSVIGQRDHGLHAPGHGRKVEGGGTVDVARLRVCAGFQQGAHGTTLSHLRADVQRSEVADAGGGLEVGSRISQQLDQFDVPEFGGPVQRGHAVALGHVDLGPFGQQ